MSRHTGGGQNKKEAEKRRAVASTVTLVVADTCTGRSIYNNDKSHSLKLFPSSLTLSLSGV